MLEAARRWAAHAYAQHAEVLRVSCFGSPVDLLIYAEKEFDEIQQARGRFARVLAGEALWFPRA